MIVKVSARGTSFIGGGHYYFHDKKQDGEKERTTTERIDWTHTRNLTTENPEFAARIMAATAMNKDHLKQQAGIKNTGQKSKGDVYVYSLAWHPEETGKFDKTQMLEAADQSLKSIGAQDHQAVVVAHNDEPHPHIHIMVNLVHPQTGKNLNLSNDYKKLELWAHEYRKSRGEEKIYCIQRTKKMNAIAAKKRGESVPFVRGCKNTPRKIYNAVAGLKTPANNNDTKIFMDDQKKKDFALSQQGVLMSSRHRAQWAALQDNYVLKKNYISQTYKKDKDSLKSKIYEKNKPVFSEVYRQQWREKRDFERREKRISGKLENMISAVLYSNKVGKGSNQGILNMAFNSLSKKGRRENHINRKHKAELAALRKEQNQHIKKAVQNLNEERKEKMSAARQTFSYERQTVIDTQKTDKKQLQGKWKERNARRIEGLKVIEKREELKAQEAPLTKEEKREKIKHEFDQIKHGTVKRKRKPRPRGRSRGRSIE